MGCVFYLPLFVSCIAVNCGQLDSPLNGRVIQTGMIFGSIALYNCDEGFTLTGSVTRTCQPIGLWSGIEPYCAGECVCACVCLHIRVYVIVCAVCVCVCVMQPLVCGIFNSSFPEFSPKQLLTVVTSLVPPTGQ